MKFYPEIQIQADRGVYPPSEDTFLLLSAVQASQGQRILEIGTGTGIIALHCAKAGCLATAIDISPDAVKCAMKNAEMNGLDIEIVWSNLFENVKGDFDLIIFNPPYLSSEGSEKLAPEDALPLIGGEKGHEISLLFLDQAPGFLNPGGRIYLLISSESQIPIMEKASSIELSVRIVAEQRIFFEVLSVMELQMGNP